LGFPTGRTSTCHQAIFLALLPGIKEEEAPTSTKHQYSAVCNFYIQSYLASFMQVNEPGVEKDYKGKKVLQPLGDGMQNKMEHAAA
jgi:hypothetical protein